MTREQVLAMSPQELAEATAVHVMGWQWQQLPSIGNVVERGYWWSLACEEPVYSWNPAEDMRDAWEAAEKIEKEITVKRYEGMGGWSYWCRISGSAAEVFDFEISHGKTAPEAICKCLLLAVMGK
jgi:hypothetical protein